MSLVETYLREHPDFDVRLYYVWMPMFPLRLEHAALPKMTAAVAERGDTRVAQYWDGGRAVGRAFGRLADGSVDARRTWPEDDGRYTAWDAFLVFDGAATWRDGAADPLQWGTTIVQEEESLIAALDSLRTQQARSAAPAGDAASG